MRDFKKLDVWKKAHELTLDVYRATATFPNSERYGLTSQLQRAAASIGANLAEGSGRQTDGDYKRFVDIASGSACEVEYHLLLARDLSLLKEEDYNALNLKVNEVKRMLFGLALYLKSSPRTYQNQPR
jgi:four helix bundle protein